MARLYAKGADLGPQMRGMVEDLHHHLNKRRKKPAEPAA